MNWSPTSSIAPNVTAHVEVISKNGLISHCAGLLVKAWVMKLTNDVQFHFFIPVVSIRYRSFLTWKSLPAVDHMLWKFGSGWNIHCLINAYASSNPTSLGLPVNATDSWVVLKSSPLKLLKVNLDLFISIRLVIDKFLSHPGK